MPFDFLEDLFDRDRRRRPGRRSGLGGLLSRVLGGDRDERSRSYRRRDDDDDDDDDRRDWDRRRRRDRDTDLFD